MKDNRLGCFTGTGFPAAFITLFVIVGAAFASGGQMFSSGDLNDQIGETIGGVYSHAQIHECKACHTAPWDPDLMADRCAACHTDIAEQMFDVALLHGAITQKDSTLACRDCHPEHRGENSSLTDLRGNVFPHEAMGYSLNGHQRNVNGKPFECTDCHGGAITTFASDSCQTCHRQIDIVFAQTHLLAFGEDCLLCHDGIDTYGDDFDHNKFSFQITGEHIGLDCSRCHVNARSASDLQATLQDCYACHHLDDPHDFAYGTGCIECHSTEGWIPADFDHNLSAFKLDGAHVQVACESCHTNQIFKRTPSTCVSCHAEPEVHAGRFGADCASCHTTAAWTPASYNGPHTFPMDHEDANGDCQICHPSSLMTYTCYGCHEHNPSKIEQEHREEGISDFQYCVSCHPTGREREGGSGDDDD